MKKFIRILCCSFVFLYSLVLVGFGSAHGDEPRLEISIDHVNPGGVVDLRGVDFERDELVTLMLVNPQKAIPFGEVLADVEGVFLLNLTVPLDTPEGTYNFLAITDDHSITSPDLVVQGAPITGEEGGGQGVRDEDDPLLAPMPTFAPGVVPGNPPEPTAASSVANGVNDDTEVNFPLIVLGGIILTAGILTSLIRLWKNR